VQPLSSPHKDGRGVEHLAPLAADYAYGEALDAIMNMLIKCEVSDKISDLSVSATLLVLLKKEVETMAKIKRVFGDAYLQSHRPLGMGSSLVELASKCAQILLKGNLGLAVGSTPFFCGDQGRLRPSAMGPLDGDGVQ
jgi:hypothetical protein